MKSYTQAPSQSRTNALSRGLADPQPGYDRARRLAAGGGQRQQIAVESRPAPVGLTVTPAPDFELTTADGQVIRLGDLRGKVVLLNFWATWCPPCKAEMPDLEALHVKYGAEHDFLVLGVNDRENAVDVAVFARRERVSFPLVIDRDGRVIEKLFKVRDLPTSMIIDRDGQHPRHLARPDRQGGHAGPAGKGLVSCKTDEEVMTPIPPRERVRTAIRHIQPDRTPYQISFTTPARRKLVEHYGTADLDELIGNHLAKYRRGRRMNSVGWRIAPAFSGTNSAWWWNRTIDRDIGMVERYPLAERSLNGFTFPDPLNPQRFAALPAFIQANPDRFRYVSNEPPPSSAARSLRGMEALLMDMLEAPDFVDELFDVLLSFSLAAIDEFVEYDIDGILFGRRLGPSSAA